MNLNTKGTTHLSGIKKQNPASLLLMLGLLMALSGVEPLVIARSGPTNSAASSNTKSGSQRHMRRRRTSRHRQRARGKAKKMREDLRTGDERAPGNGSSGLGKMGTGGGGGGSGEGIGYGKGTGGGAGNAPPKNVKAAPRPVMIKPPQKIKPPQSRDEERVKPPQSKPMP